MPQPAYRWAIRPAQQRAAQGHAELPVLGQVGPPHPSPRTNRGPGPRAPVSAAPRHLARLASHGGRGMQQPGELQRVERARRAGRGWAWPGAGYWPPAPRPGRAQRSPTPSAGARLADDPPRNDRVLLAVLVAAQQLLAQVVVDRRVRASPDRAGQGHGAGALPFAPDQQLRAWPPRTSHRLGRRRTRTRTEKASRSTPRIAAGS